MLAKVTLLTFTLYDFNHYMRQLLTNLSLTALQGKSERIKNFPYPKQYGSIGYHFVHIFMWLLPMAIIPSFAVIGLEIAKTNPFIGEYFVWFNIPFTVIVIWVFNTMLRIGLAGETHLKVRQMMFLFLILQEELQEISYK